MFSLTERIVERWRSRKAARAESTLVDLKARYHTFRALLANNELSLDLLKSLEQFFASSDFHRPDFAETVEELGSVTYELIDGLNRLTGGAHHILYRKHRVLSDAVKQALTAVMDNPSEMPRCVFFGSVPADAEAEVGSKASSIAFLKRMGFGVPDGFVITPEGSAEFFAATGIDNVIRRKSTRMLPVENAEDQEAEAAQIREIILGGALPDTLRDEMRQSYLRLTSRDSAAVSVRSSAMAEDRPGHSFAGQFETVLNVQSFEAFEQAYKEVLAGNFSARAAAYRRHAGLPAAGNDMAVICQRMVAARAAGILFTVDPVSPANGRMLISAVQGLGTAAVAGAAPADIYKPLRTEPETEEMEQWAQVAEKTYRVVASGQGGLERESLTAEEQAAAVLSPEEVMALVRLGRRIESVFGAPQDIEWAVTGTGEITVLQSRGIRVPIRKREIADSIRGKVLMRAGQCASAGRSIGKVKLIRSQSELDHWKPDLELPRVMVLRQSLVDAARRLPEVTGVIVEVGNPADHLSCVAREHGCPMVTGAVKATEILRDGDWIILDAGRTSIHEAPPDVRPEPVRREARPPAPVKIQRPRTEHPRSDADRLRTLIEPLNLTDAYGPTFSIQECKSLHDIIRYTHEMAVMAMFEAGDEVVENAWGLVHRMKDSPPFRAMIVDLGGGIAPAANGSGIRVEDILSKPFRAFWEGVTTPGLRWNVPPPTAGISGLFSRAMLDGRSARPVGSQNYALIARDYMNLNARVEFHFTMIDTVCGATPRENYIRFRFKGGGTMAVQRERRTRLIADILKTYSFLTDLRGDLLTASIAEIETEEVEERLVAIGRLVGFTRLLDAAMRDDGMPAKLVTAFLEGDYALERLEN